MSEHTTARPAAMASTSTIPKLSLPVAGEQNRSPVAYQRGRSALATWPRKGTCSRTDEATPATIGGRGGESPAPGAGGAPGAGHPPGQEPAHREEVGAARGTGGGETADARCPPPCPRSWS